MSYNNGYNQRYPHHPSARTKTPFPFLHTMKRNVAEKFGDYKLFQSSASILPTTSNSHSQHSTPPILSTFISHVKKVPNALSKIKTTPAPPTAVIFSWSMAILSLLILFSGVTHLRDYSKYTTFSCNSSVCTFSEFGLDANTLSTPTITTFPREAFERCNSVRIKDGAITTTAGLKRRQLRKLGYSFSITYKHMFDDNSGGEVKELLVSRNSIGKRASREKMSAISKKMKDMEGEFVFMEGLGWNVGSCVKILSGAMLLALMSMIGEFESESYNEKYEAM